MNRRDFLKNPALPAMAIAAVGGVAASGAEDEAYIRVPAVGTKVRVLDTHGRTWLSGKTGAVRSVQIVKGANLLIQCDQPLGPWGTGISSFLNSTYCWLDEIEVIDPNPRWVLVPKEA